MPTAADDSASPAAPAGGEPAGVAIPGQAALYVVATPIGNLGDISRRALEVLAQVDEIFCEDTRASSVLLRHYGIQNKLSALHDHNEGQKAEVLLAKLHAGQRLALISDAGTPLISDPGYNVVAQARAAGLAVYAVPGACALIAALSISGLPCERFCFEGFLPSSSKARYDRLLALQAETRTVVFYESTHRIVDSLEDVQRSFGADRVLAVVKEISKHFERCLSGPVASIIQQLKSDPALQRGEFVVIVQGSPQQEETLTQARHAFHVLSAEMSKSQAAKLAAKLTGVNRRLIYAES